MHKIPSNLPGQSPLPPPPSLCEHGQPQTRSWSIFSGMLILVVLKCGDQKDVSIAIDRRPFVYNIGSVYIISAWIIEGTAEIQNELPRLDRTDAVEQLAEKKTYFGTKRRPYVVTIIITLYAYIWAPFSCTWYTYHIWHLLFEVYSSSYNESAWLGIYREIVAKPVKIIINIISLFFLHFSAIYHEIEFNVIEILLANSMTAIFIQLFSGTFRIFK